MTDIDAGVQASFGPVILLTCHAFPESIFDIIQCWSVYEDLV
jgi:hypothetical protein